MAKEEQASESVTLGHIRSHGCRDLLEQIDWVPVPDRVIIRNAKNPYQEGMPNGVRIRCYVPAPQS